MTAPEQLSREQAAKLAAAMADPQVKAWVQQQIIRAMVRTVAVRFVMVAAVSLVLGVAIGLIFG